MPRWTDAPPKDGQGHGLPIRRTPPVGKIVATITSETMIGCDTHFYHGRTTPCEKPDCPACNSGMPYRWHGYVTACCYRTHQHFIFEMTAQAAETLKEYQKAHGTLRGCLFQAERTQRKINGRVIIQTKTAPIEQMNLPKALDLCQLMAVIWQLPTTNVYTDGLLKNVPRVAIDVDERGTPMQPGIHGT